ncbi:Uncharacterized protein ChrSV_0727 [Chromobacterium vaccinii]|nr:Uncharacterized protein ChrSW_0727 [Chromobacterium vaccinii]QND88186.1 Uncharacterized protein ChrSV_0727 [Chromobacterium vaccinii]
MNVYLMGSKYIILCRYISCKICGCFKDRSTLIFALVFSGF